MSCTQCDMNNGDHQPWCPNRGELTPSEKAAQVALAKCVKPPDLSETRTAIIHLIGFSSHAYKCPATEVVAGPCKCGYSKAMEDIALVLANIRDQQLVQPVTKPRDLVYEWAKRNRYIFVSRSYGNYTTAPVGLDALEDLAKMARGEVLKSPTRIPLSMADECCRANVGLSSRASRVACGKCGRVWDKEPLSGVFWLEKQ